MAIHSVTAIPLEDWSLDYIRPKSVCIKKDDQCIQTTYPIAPDSMKVVARKLFFIDFSFEF